MTVMGQTIIILNSLDVAIELLDKKSAIFSDRPVLVFGGIMYVYLRILLPPNSLISNYSGLVGKIRCLCYTMERGFDK